MKYTMTLKDFLNAKRDYYTRRALKSRLMKERTKFGQRAEAMMDLLFELRLNTDVLSAEVTVDDTAYTGFAD